MHSREILATNVGLVPTGLEGADSRRRTDVDWQTAMKKAVRSGAELRRRLGLAADNLTATARVFSDFCAAGIPEPDRSGKPP